MKKSKYIAGLITILAATLANGQLNYTNNTVGGTNSSVAAGNANHCVARDAIIGGGWSNTNTAHRGTIGGGGANWALTDYSTIPGGVRGKTRSFGQLAYASGTFDGTGAGNAQFGLYVLRGSIPGTGTVELALDGSGTEHITVPANGSFLFDIDVVCRSTSPSNSIYGNFFHWKVAVENRNGSLACIDLDYKEKIDHNTNLVFTAECVNDKFKLKGTGEANNTVYWVATVKATELVKP